MSLDAFDKLPCTLTKKKEEGEEWKKADDEGEITAREHTVADDVVVDAADSIRRESARDAMFCFSLVWVSRIKNKT